MLEGVRSRKGGEGIRGKRRVLRTHIHTHTNMHIHRRYNKEDGGEG